MKRTIMVVGLLTILFSACQKQGLVNGNNQDGYTIPKPTFPPPVILLDPPVITTVPNSSVILTTSQKSVDTLKNFFTGDLVGKNLTLISTKVNLPYGIVQYSIKSADGKTLYADWKVNIALNKVISCDAYKEIPLNLVSKKPIIPEVDYMACFRRERDNCIKSPTCLGYYMNWNTHSQVVMQFMLKCIFG